MCIVIGAVTGLIGTVLASISGWAEPVLGEAPHASMFAISSVIGYSLASIIMGVVLSGVDSVIVCFAEAPGTSEKTTALLRIVLKHSPLYDPLFHTS